MNTVRSQSTATAIVSANVITGMAGAEKIDDITFTKMDVIKLNTNSEITMTAPVNIKATEFENCITISSADVIVIRSGSEEIISFKNLQVENVREKCAALKASVIIGCNQCTGFYTAAAPLSVTINYN